MTRFRLDDDDLEDEDEDDDEDASDSDDEDEDEDDEDDEEEEETWQVGPRQVRILTSPIELPRLAGISSSAKLELTWLDRVAHVFYP